MTRRRYGRLTGRAPIAAIATLSALAALTACSGDTDPDAKDASDDTLAECQPADPPGTFSYTDGRGEKVDLDEVPTTVVAQSSLAAALWDAGYQVDGIFGEVSDEPLPGDRQLGDVDIEGMEVLGKTFGEFDTDAYARMQPDLLLDYSFDGETLWYVPAKQSKQVYDLAPAIGVNGAPESIDDAIDVFVDLATKLGADTTCNEDLTTDKAEYADALSGITEASKDEELEVVVASPTDASLYVVNPTKLPETRTLSEAGVNLVVPEGKGVDIFEEYSWEKASDYANADVILLDGRTTDDMLAKLATIDTWANLPAVKAGQVYTWYAGAPYSYHSYAGIFGELEDQLEDAEPLD